jgi:predicted ArsR family transcriptional regulator
VRPHLERMREVGLLEVRTEQRRGVGRPQHLYALAPDAPTLGLEPSAFPMLARLVLQAAAGGGLDPGELAEAGREQGHHDAQRRPEGSDALEVLIDEQARLGFDPEVVDLDGGAVMAFAHCPFRELAEAHPDLVCQLHCGLVEGLVSAVGNAEVVRFHPLVDRTPCQVELALA